MPSIAEITQHHHRPWQPENDVYVCLLHSPRLRYWQVSLNGISSFLSACWSRALLPVSTWKEGTFSAVTTSREDVALLSAWSSESLGKIASLNWPLLLSLLLNSFPRLFAAGLAFARHVTYSKLHRLPLEDDFRMSTYLWFGRLFSWNVSRFNVRAHVAFFILMSIESSCILAHTQQKSSPMVIH